MKLLYISQYYPPEVGACAVRSEAMVRYLSEQGWDTDVLSELPNYPTGNVYPGYKHKFHQQEKWNGTNVHRLWVWPNARNNVIEKLGIFISFFLSALTYYLQNPKRYDIVYASSPPIFVGIAGALIAKIQKTQFVLEVRDIWPDVGANSGVIEKDSLFFKIGHILENWLYEQADSIVTVTEGLSKIINQRSNETPVHLIHNGVDLKNFYPIPEPSKIIGEYDHSKFRIGYVGSLGIAHDLETMVKAAKICEDDKDIEFIIVGDGSGSSKLTRLIDELEPKNLKWVGQQAHDLIPAYISSFDLALNPLYDTEINNNALSVKFFEYLACGTPVISAARGLHEKISGKNCSSITIEPGDAQLLVETIKQLKTNSSKLNEMGIEGREFVKARYSRKQLAYQLSEILHNLTPTNKSF